MKETNIFITNYLWMKLFLNVIWQLSKLWRMASSGMLGHIALVRTRTRTRATWCNIQEDAILLSHHHKSLRSYWVNYISMLSDNWFSYIFFINIIVNFLSEMFCFHEYNCKLPLRYIWCRDICKSVPIY
jgi:hypothetical protein